MELAPSRSSRSSRRSCIRFEDLRIGKVDTDKAYLWSMRQLEAERPLCKTRAERLAACTAHLKNPQELREVVVALF